jgi:uncharacterized protein
VKTNPFLVNIAALRPTPSGRHHVVRSGRLDGLAITSSAVPDDAEVTVDVNVEVVAGGVVVTGTVSTTWVGECRRCLRSVQGPLVANVREVYERASRVRDDELDDDEAETYPLAGDTVDLVPLARDAVLLELPLAPLCRADCAGLCPSCGADRGEQPCDCIDQPGHPVWAVLDGLRAAVEDTAADTPSGGRDITTNGGDGGSGEARRDAEDANSEHGVDRA